MDWSYPVFKSKEGARSGKQEGTVAQAVAAALPEREAFLYLSGQDRRPLLVLRECKTCNGTDNALLSTAEDNARTFVMARWFHCVKLPTQVLEADHPFHALFDEEHPPHLFLCRWDGSDPVALQGDQSRTELWDAMLGVLASNYAGNAKAAVAEIEKVLAQYDVMDARLEQIQKSIEKAAEDENPNSRKMKALQKEIEQARRDLEDLQRRERAASDLGLKPEIAQAAHADA